MLQPDGPVGVGRRFPCRGLEPAFQLPPVRAGGAGKLLDAQRRVDVLLHGQQRALDQRIVAAQVERNAGLRLFPFFRLVDDHDVKAFLRARLADMPVHQEGREMRGTDAAGACQPVAIDDEYAVRHRLHPLESLQEVVVVEPAHAAAIAVHQPGPMQDERPGANPDQRHARGGGGVQETHIVRMQVLRLVDQSADDDDVIETRRVAQPLLRVDRDARTRRDRLHGRGEHAPSAEDGPTAVAFVGGEAQDVDEIGEGAKREPPRQDEADRKPRPRCRFSRLFCASQFRLPGNEVSRG